MDRAENCADTIYVGVPLALANSPIPLAPTGFSSKPEFLQLPSEFPCH